MEIDITRNELFEYIKMQTKFFFPDKYDFEGDDVKSAFDLSLERLEYCFKHISFPIYCDQKNQTFFHYLHSDQYAAFLYFLSNSLWNISENKVLCDKLLYLNRCLNSVFISYKCEMPDIFFLGHPVGTIVGNAKYSDFLVVFQNVTINTGGKGSLGNKCPVLGRGLFLAAGSKIIGDESIGDRVSIGVDAVVYNKKIPDDKVVIKNEEGQVIVRDRKGEKCMAQNYFNVEIDKYIKEN